MGGVHLKKYWKTFVISVVIVMTISTYYVYAKMSNNDLAYTIKTVRGDDKQLEGVAFNMVHHDRSGIVSRNIQVSKEGAKEVTNSSFFGMSDNRSGDALFSRLIQEHRQYMRGKEPNRNAYYEDQEHLVYANILFENNVAYNQEGNPSSFQVDVLNKKTNERSSFEVDVQKEMVNKVNMNVQDVTLKDGNIQMLVHIVDHKGIEELHIYTIDMDKKILKQDELLVKTQVQQDITSSIYLFNDRDMLQGSEYYLYGIANTKTTDRENNSTSWELYLYHHATNKVEKLEIPIQLHEYLYNAAIRGTDIVVSRISETKAVIWNYNIVNGQWRELIRFDNGVTGELPMYQMREDKLYVMYHESDGIKMIIHHLRTGELLYEGKIVGKDTKNLMPSFEFYNDRPTGLKMSITQ